jgi:hypothetical protein
MIWVQRLQAHRRVWTQQLIGVQVIAAQCPRDGMCRQQPDFLSFCIRARSTDQIIGAQHIDRFLHRLQPLAVLRICSISTAEINAASGLVNAVAPASTTFSDISHGHRLDLSGARYPMKFSSAQAAA